MYIQPLWIPALLSSSSCSSGFKPSLARNSLQHKQSRQLWKNTDKATHACTKN